MVAGAEDIKHARFVDARDRKRVAHLIARDAPDDPVFLFRPGTLRQKAKRFLRGFPGAVSYAVKANPNTRVLETLCASGINTFDVASIAEMRAVRTVCPQARLHYHNPVRSRSEITMARNLGVSSWSVDRLSELDKLGDLPCGTEIAVRMALPVKGAAYDFGSKFGAGFDETVVLLRGVASRGLTPSLTFHPGTQCTDPTAWARYIAACGQAAQDAGVGLKSLNVGGGFPSDTGGIKGALQPIFDAITGAHHTSFPKNPPQLWCEPGRAMVADAMWLLLRVKGRSDTALYLNDGLYGGLGEWRDMPVPGRQIGLAKDGREHDGPSVPYTIFGPTCDSLDRLPNTWLLPHALSDDDYILIDGAGAYSTALVTGFNGYGTNMIVDLSHQDLLAGQRHMTD